MLRQALVQVCRGLLPELRAEADGEQGDVRDSLDFLLLNFTEMNKLWVRMQHQGAQRDRCLHMLHGAIVPSGALVSAQRCEGGQDKHAAGSLDPAHCAAIERWSLAAEDCCCGNRDRREKERAQLSDLVGKNLTYISQLEGLDYELYLVRQAGSWLQQRCLVGDGAGSTMLV